MKWARAIAGLCLMLAGAAWAQAVDRPLRYTPDHGDFVIENGQEFFNRPLYGSNTAFRVDAGDKPEFSLFLPGRGGNLRLGIKTPTSVKWLSDCDHIVTRYRAGRILYEIHDAALDSAALRLSAVAMSEDEGLILRIELTNAERPIELLFAFGGANGDKGSRNGDIGCEREPVSQFFALKAQYCRGNTFEIDANRFVLQSKPGRVAGIMPPGSSLAVGDAQQWASPGQLLASAGRETQTPVMLGHVSLESGKPLFLALQRMTDQNQSITNDQLPELFGQSEAHFRAISMQIEVQTPDEFINAAVPALCIAADGVWDDRAQAFMHGAVAWRVKLLGWRGVYAGDALGWHDRTRLHLSNWTSKQNTDPVPSTQPGADPASNLARSERALHSNGDLTHSHYDMNLVAIDAIFRHLLWTGDHEYARQVWPVIQRHLAWERRLFRRTFGPDNLPLYEAYCCIWASDDLQYSGGGVAHASAYNYWHNLMAARVAKWIGEDPQPYAREAELIRRAMIQQLWLPDRGHFAEFKDLLGEQLVHPAAALWTHYHTIDSRVPDAFQAYQMGQYIDTQIAHIPIRGLGVPDDGRDFILPTTNWLPYMWSTNNVVLAETMHTALADWLAARPEHAFAEFKGSILDSMFTSLCPGDLHMASYFDAYRHESQRDFADPIGITSRALVEGLFGIMPDAIDSELLVRPGFPARWDNASIRHPDFSSSFHRAGKLETYTIESRFKQPLRLRLQCSPLSDSIDSIKVNGQQTPWRSVDDAIGRPMIEILAEPGPRWEVSIQYAGDAIPPPPEERIVAIGSKLAESFAPAKLIAVSDPQGILQGIQTDADSFDATIMPAEGHHMCFARVREGMLSWWMPIRFEIRPAFQIITLPTQDADHLRFTLRNNSRQPLDTDATIHVGPAEQAIHLSIASLAEREFAFPSAGLLPGTNPVEIQLNDGQTISGDVTNWQIVSRADASDWRTIDLTKAFNDSVTQIFKNEYLSPRSPYCSLSMPKQGLGGWCTINMSADIDDSGLRAESAKHAGRITLPQGVPFATPSQPGAKNIAFVSQWENYPKSLTVPLDGSASHAYLLLAGSTNPMQSRMDDGEVIVTYADGSTDRLALRNPQTWWPIERDYYIDDYAFARPEPIPPRLDLKTALVRTWNASQFNRADATIPGGAATVLDLPLNPAKPLKSLTVRARANEVVIGLMSLTLLR